MDMYKNNMMRKVYSVIKYSFVAFLATLALGMFQLVYFIRSSYEQIDFHLGLPFDYFFFTRDEESRLHSFDARNFIYNFLIFLVVLLIYKYLFDRLAITKKETKDEMDLQQENGH